MTSEETAFICPGINAHDTDGRQDSRGIRAGIDVALVLQAIATEEDWEVAGDTDPGHHSTQLVRVGEKEGWAGDRKGSHGRAAVLDGHRKVEVEPTTVAHTSNRRTEETVAAVPGIPAKDTLRKMYDALDTTNCPAE